MNGRRSSDGPGSGSRSGSGDGLPGPPGGSPGWRYTLRVPSWSQAQLPDGETAVFFQVEVTVMPPQGVPRKRSVGRRFSSFLTLYRRLREELGPAALHGLDPPPRRSLAGVNRKPELIEQRRWELEQWLWRLTESAVVANSVMMFHFCELGAAARMRPRAPAPAPSTQSVSSASPQLGSPAGSVGGAAAAAGLFAAAGSSAQLSPVHSSAPSWSGSEPSELHAGESSSSSLAAAATAASAAEGEAAQLRSQHLLAPALHQQQSAALMAHAPTHSGLSAGLRRADAQLPGGAAGGSAVGGLRLALPVQQRGAAKAAARRLAEQLATAQADLEDAARTIASDQLALAQLAAELQQLQDAAAKGGGGGGSSAAAAALKQQLSAVQAERDALLQQRERVAALEAEREVLQQDAQEARRQAAALEEELSAARQAQAQARQGQDAERQQLLGVLEGQCLGLQAQLQDARLAAAAAAAEREAAAAKSREDLKLLAKEVKSLRRQLAAAEEQLQGQREQQAPQPPSSAAADGEAEGERQRLRQQVQEQHAEMSRLREQLAAAVAATTAPVQEQANGEPPDRSARNASAQQQRQQQDALLDVADGLRRLLGACGVDGTEAHAGGAADVLVRLAAAKEELDGIEGRVREQLLSNGDAGGADGGDAGEPGAGRLRRLLAGLLLDAAAAKQQQHELLRSALAVSAQLQGLEERLLSPTASPVRRAPTA